MKSLTLLAIVSTTLIMAGIGCASESTRTGPSSNLTDNPPTSTNQKLVADVKFKGTLKVGNTPIAFSANLKYGENIGGDSDWVLIVDIPPSISSPAPQPGEKTIKLFAVYHENLATLSSSKKVINDRSAEWRLLVKTTGTVSILKAFYFGQPVSFVNVTANPPSGPEHRIPAYR